MNLQDIYIRARDTYENQDYLDAYEVTKDLWDRPEILPQLDLDQLLLAGRMAAVLGASKLSNHLRREAVRQYPEDPKVFFYCAGQMRQYRTLYDVLRYYEDNPFTPTDDPYTDGLSLAQRAVSWAFVREFRRAHGLMDQAYALDTDRPWLHYSHSIVYHVEDKPEQSLREAEEAFAGAPRSVYGMICLSASLAKMRRYEEAAERSWKVVTEDDPQSFQILLTALRNAGILGDRENGGGGLWSGRMLEICDNLQRTAPLADSWTRREMALVRIDSLRINGQIEQAAAAAENIYHPFFDKAFKHYRQSPEGERVVISHKPVIQDREHCLPASVSVVLSHFDDDLSQHDMAEDVTYGGTQIWNLTQWLQERDYQVVNFVVTEQTAQSVLEAGVPFVMHQAWDSGAHSVAVVGYDQQLGLLLIDDPNSPRVSEMIASTVRYGEEPVGSFGMLVAPEGVTLPQLPEDVVEPAEAFNEYHRLVSTSGSKAAVKVVDALERKLPDHPVTAYLKAVALSNCGRNSEAFELFKAQHQEHPRCVYLRRGLINVLRALENSARIREVLREILIEGSVCGVKPDSSYKYPMMTYKCQYADYLRASAKTHAKAYRYIASALREGASDAEPYHILADIMLSDDRFEEALLPMRIATLLEPWNPHYALSYCHLATRQGDPEGGLEYMRERAEQYGRKPRGIEAWESYASALEDAGRAEEALRQMKELLEFHGDEPEALAAAGPFFARAGQWKLALETVKKLQSCDNQATFLATAVDVLWRKRDLEKACQLTRKWCEIEPQNHQAREAQLGLLSQIEGSEKALELAQRWYEENPDNELFENTLFGWLDRVQIRDRKIAALRHRVERDPMDAWAWRELGFEYANELTGASGAQREQAQRDLDECIGRCKELYPGAPTIALTAIRAEANGESDAALKLWFEALDDDPGYNLAIRRACDLSFGMGEEIKRDVYARLEKHLLADTQLPDISFLMRIASNYGLEAVAGLLEELEQRHQDSPDLIECRADLVLNYAVGMGEEEKNSLGTVEQIVAMLEDAIIRRPHHRGICLSLSDFYTRSEQFDRAEKLLKSLLNRERSDVVTMLRLAELYQQTQRLDQSRKVLEMAVQRSPGESESWYQLAVFLAKTDELEKAVEVLKTGLEKLPENVALREKAVGFFFYYGGDELAVDIARQGTEVFPDGAYMWFLYGKALHHAERTSDNTDPAVALRKALEYNSVLFDAAYTLSNVLIARRQYDEARDVLDPFSHSPEYRIFALAQMAMVKRTMGEHLSDEEVCKEATADMLAIVEESPEYAWGWERLVEWVERDEDWELARKVFAEVPPGMRHEGDFRAARLRLLTAAGVEGLEGEWNRLLEEFPREVSIVLERFDMLWDQDRRKAAMDLLEQYCSSGQRILGTEIRLAMGYSNFAQYDKLLATAQRIWLNQDDISTEHDRTTAFVWNQIFHTEDKIRQRAMNEFVDLLGGDQPVRPGAIAEFCERICKETFPPNRALMLHIECPPGTSFWKRASKWVQIVFSHNKESIREALLKKVVHVMACTGWAQSYHFSEVLLAGNDLDMMPRVANEILALRPGIEKDCTDMWGALGYAYLTQDRKWVVRHMASWRERPGAKFWQVTNFLVAHGNEHPDEVDHRFEDCCELLENYEHAPGTARFVAWLAVDSALRAGYYDMALELYRNHEAYLDRDGLDYEFMPPEFSYMPELLPLYIEMMTQGWSDELDVRYRRCRSKFQRLPWAQATWDNVRSHAGDQIRGVEVD